MATVWITYAWIDNENNDVDFIAQELLGAGLTVKLDRWNIRAGTRLWEQIDKFITDAKESDAWLLYATPNSLGSEACKEEYAYALDRALKSRGNTFPIIALFPSSVDDNLLPSGIRTRLYVSLTDSEWKGRIKAAAEGRSPNIDPPQVEPIFHKIYPPTIPGSPYKIEVRPRAGSWFPFVAGVPIDEKDKVKMLITYSAAGKLPSGSSIMFGSSSPSEDGKFWLEIANHEATPTMSFYVQCEQLPSQLLFGTLGGPVYILTFGK